MRPIARDEVTWFVCVSVSMSGPRAVLKWLNRSRADWSLTKNHALDGTCILAPTGEYVGLISAAERRCGLSLRLLHSNLLLLIFIIFVVISSEALLTVERRGTWSRCDDREAVHHWRASPARRKHFISTQYSFYVNNVYNVAQDYCCRQAPTITSLLWRQ